MHANCWIFFSFFKNKTKKKLFLFRGKTKKKRKKWSSLDFKTSIKNSYGPHFEDIPTVGNVTNITVPIGNAVYLNCRISLLQDKTVCNSFACEYIFFILFIWQFRESSKMVDGGIHAYNIVKLLVPFLRLCDWCKGNAQFSVVHFWETKKILKRKTNSRW